jgi:hypothetical protein
LAGAARVAGRRVRAMRGVGGSGAGSGGLIEKAHLAVMSVS